MDAEQAKVQYGAILFYQKWQGTLRPGVNCISFPIPGFNWYKVFFVKDISCMAVRLQPLKVLGLLLCLSCFSAKSQTVLNVANFGARGDVVRFSVNTVSNSTVVSVAGTNTFSSADIGKVIEVFRAGPWVTYNGGVVVTQQDIICLI